MGKKLFVGGLPYETDDAQLKELFGSCGAVVSAKVIIDKATNRSKGFGFVEMTTDDEAQAALLKFNNFTMGTRRIMVNEARPMEPRPAGGGRERPSPGGAPRPSGGGGERNPNFGADSKAFAERKNRYDNKKKGRGGEGFDKKGGFGGKDGKKGKGNDEDNDNDNESW